MISRVLLYVLAIAAAIVMNSALVFAQAEDRFPGDHKREPPPLGVREMLEKMRISKEKKDYDEMMARGDEVRQIIADMAKGVSERGQLTASDREKLEVLEKNVKKIRSELGGSDDDDKADEQQVERSSISAAMDELVTSVDTLLDELKRSNRFTISVPAIEASNTTLRLVRFVLHK
jgi:hypothetical protein